MSVRDDEKKTLLKYLYSGDPGNTSRITRKKLHKLRHENTFFESVQHRVHKVHSTGGREDIMTFGGFTEAHLAPVCGNVDFHLLTKPFLCRSAKIVCHETTHDIGHEVD